MAGFFEKLKGNKLYIILISALAAIAVLVAFGGDDGTVKDADSSGLSDTELADQRIKDTEYKLKMLLEAMDGIDNVSVMITPEDCGEDIYASGGSYSEGNLTHKEYLISDGEAVKVRFVFPKLRGVAVVCSGGANPINQEKIVSLVSSLFDLPSNRVFVTG